MNESEITGVFHGIVGRELFSISGTPVTTATALTFFLILVVTFWISAIVQKALERGMRRRGVAAEGTVAAARRLTHYAILALGFGVGLQTVGIDLTALFAAGAFFAVAMGFAMQNITQNFVSGVILLVERTIKPQDVLEVEGRMVRVLHLGTRATVVRTLDEEELIVPNSVLVQSTVTNYTLRDPLVRLRVMVGVTYDSDMKQVRQVLEHATAELPWRSRQRDPVILMKAFGSSSVDWEVSVWVEEPWRLAGHSSELHEAIWFALKDAGIVIAFPQLDLHLDPPVTRALAASGSSESA
ncbi:MAG TPA: mechanosensitive ion channel domain-containing protein [bacterium]|nr:mechanosensitive ion channel domain-containing protein [bacterium]